jgi:hypothetical protein
VCVVELRILGGGSNCLGLWSDPRVCRGGHICVGIWTAKRYRHIGKGGRGHGKRQWPRGKIKSHGTRNARARLAESQEVLIAE